ncbi:hypothetical protein ACFQ9X_33570 [Catenulispora yoronensis]
MPASTPATPGATPGATPKPVPDGPELARLEVALSALVRWRRVHAG